MKSEGSFLNKTLFPLGGILLLTFLAFSPTLTHSIETWDDEVHLSQNPHVIGEGGVDLKGIFTSSVNHTYIPLTVLSFALEYRFFGDHPFIYHLDNVLLHLVVTTLVFLLARKMGFPVLTAAFASLLFGVHPMRVESVAWATERKDVLYASFYLSSLIFYWNHLQGRRWAYVWSLLFAALSILAKPMALSLPLVLWVLDWFSGRRWDARVAWEKIPYFAVIVPVALITYLEGTRASGSGVVDGALMSVWGLVFYLRKFVFPWELVPLYPLPGSPAWNAHFVIPVFVVGLLMAVLWRWRNNRLLIFAFVYFGVSIFFLLRFVDTTRDITFVADRFMYLPSLGFCLLFGEAISRVLDRVPASGSRWVAGGVAALFLALTVKTAQQCGVWKNDGTLWVYVSKKNPTSYRAYFGLGQFAFEEGRYEESEYYYRIALDFNPNHARAHNNLGELLYRKGLNDAALQQFRMAIMLKPDYPVAQHNYAALTELTRTLEAER